MAEANVKEVANKDVPRSRGKSTALSNAREIPIDWIVTNKYNPDTKRFAVNDLGYVNFQDEATEESVGVLFDMATGAADQKKKYCKLIEEHDPAIVELGHNILQVGQLQPVQLKPANKNGEQFQLVFGCRRLFAILYIRAKIGKAVGKVSAIIRKQNETQANLVALSENYHRKNADKVSEAEYIRDLSKLKKPKEIAKEMGITIQTVQNRIDLADVPDKYKKRVREGKLGATQAALISRDLKAGGDGSSVKKSQKQRAAENPDAPKRRTTMTWKKLAEAYDGIYLRQTDVSFADEFDDAEREYLKNSRKGTACVLGLWEILQCSNFREAEKEARERLKDETYKTRLLEDLGVEFVEEEE